MNPVSPKTTVSGFLAGLLALIALIAVLYATSQWGLAITGDSFSYLMGAHNLLEGNGMVWPRVYELVPVIAWPPVYPSAISLFAYFTGDIREAARVLNAVLFAANIILAVRLLKRAAVSDWLVLLGAVLIASCPSMLQVHTHVESEPLFFAFYLVSVTLLVKYIESPSLPAACRYGLVAGMAALTRYAGLSFALTGAATIILLTSDSLRRRLVHALAAAALAGLPLAAWFVRNAIVARDLPGRKIAWRCPDMAAGIPSLLGDVSLWFLPKAVPPVIRGIVLVFVSGFLIWLVVSFIRRRLPGDKAQIVPLTMLVFMVCYEAIVLATIFLMDPLILGYERLQLPMFMAAVIFAITAAPAIFAGRRIALYVTVVAGVFAVFAVGRAAFWAFDVRVNGQTFSSTRWASLPIIDSIRNLPDEAPIFSNAPQVIYAQTGRIAWRVPGRITFAYLPNDRWEKDIELFRKGFAAQKSFVVVFSRLGNDTDHPVERDIEANLDVRRIYEGPDGIIFARPD